METRQEVIYFSRLIPAGETVTMYGLIKSAGLVESASFRFYQGQQLSLHVYPYINHKGNHDEPLVSYAEDENGVPTDQYVSGEDENNFFDIKLEVNADDRIKIVAINTDVVNDYDLKAYISIDYFGGKNRVN